MNPIFFFNWSMVNTHNDSFFKLSCSLLIQALLRALHTPLSQLDDFPDHPLTLPYHDLVVPQSSKWMQAGTKLSLTEVLPYPLEFPFFNTSQSNLLNILSTQLICSELCLKFLSVVSLCPWSQVIPGSQIKLAK